MQGTVESPNRTNAGQVDKTTASPSPVPEGEEITNKDMEEQVRTHFFVGSTPPTFISVVICPNEFGVPLLYFTVAVLVDFRDYS